MSILGLSRYDLGINTFDTADTYSNGGSEIILGKAIQTLNLPREEIVVMTKVFFTVSHNSRAPFMFVANPDDVGYVNQHGLSRKVWLVLSYLRQTLTVLLSIYSTR
jgi:aryl-alcohol dehydrogenase-like predicted oxidoreductase